MERVVYQQMAELDDRHWWYRARRRILAELIRREAQLPEGARILEIGCGTGQATLPLARRGYSILCVELGEGLAAAARRILEKTEWS